MAEPALRARSTLTAGAGSFPTGSEVNSVAAKGSAAKAERSRSPQIDRGFAGLPRFFFTSTTKGRVGRFIVTFLGENRSFCEDLGVVYFGQAQPSTSQQLPVNGIRREHALCRQLNGFLVEARDINRDVLQTRSPDRALM